MTCNLVASSSSSSNCSSASQCNASCHCPAFSRPLRALLKVIKLPASAGNVRCFKHALGFHTCLQRRDLACRPATRGHAATLSHDHRHQSQRSWASTGQLMWRQVKQTQRVLVLPPSVHPILMPQKNIQANSLSISTMTSSSWPRESSSSSRCLRCGCSSKPSVYRQSKPEATE